MNKYRIVILAAAILLAFSFAAFSADKYAAGMIVGFGEKMSGPQQAIMKVQLGASTQSGHEELGEAVETITISAVEEKAAYKGLLGEDEMGPVGVSGTFIRKSEANGGIWVASSNNDYSPLVYANAFYTAGIRDVIMSVSSVEPVPGMMVLGVVAGAYEKLTGSALDDDALKLAAEEMLLTAKLGKSLEHYEMGAEVAAYAKEYATTNKGASASDIANVMGERIALYEREIADTELTELAECISRYAASGDAHADMGAQLATLRAEQLWLVEPKERMMDEEELAQADEELQEIIQYLDEEEKEPSFFQKNSGWIMPLGLVLIAALLAIAIAYFQTRQGNKGGKNGRS